MAVLCDIQQLQYGVCVCECDFNESFLASHLYYEAQHDYTNNLETAFCVIDK